MTVETTEQTEQHQRWARELQNHCERVSIVTEGEDTLYRLEGLRLPPKCSPAVVDALLSPSPRDSYPSRLYFAQKVECPFQKNWNFDGVVLGRHWHAHSWKVEPAGLSAQHLLLGHLEGFTRER